VLFSFWVDGLRTRLDRYHVYRAKPTAVNLTLSGDGCADDTDGMQPVLDGKSQAVDQPAPLNHAGCDTPDAIFAAVKEWQEAWPGISVQRRIDACNAIVALRLPS